MCPRGEENEQAVYLDHTQPAGWNIGRHEAGKKDEFL